MLIALIAFAVLNLLVVCYIARRLPKPSTVVNNFTVGDVASAQALKTAFRVKHPLTASEKEEAAAYRAKWKGVIADWQSDAEVLALSRINPT